MLQRQHTATLDCLKLFEFQVYLSYMNLITLTFFLNELVSVFHSIAEFACRNVRFAW